MIYVSDRKNKDVINYDKLSTLKSDYGVMLNFWFSKKLIRYQNYSIKLRFNNLFNVVIYVKKLYNNFEGNVSKTLKKVKVR